MSADLFFSQPFPRNPSTGIQSDKSGPSGSDRSSGSLKLHESPTSDKENFLTTLKQVAQDRSPTKRSEHAVETRSTRDTAAAAHGKIDDATDHEASPADTSAQNEPDPMTPEWNIRAYIEVLEKMGFGAGASDLQNMTGLNPTDNIQLSAIQSLITGVQQDQFGLTADSKAGIEQLQQFINTAFKSIDGISGQGLSPKQLIDPAQIIQWLNGLTTGFQAQDGSSGLLMGEGAAASGAIAAEAAGSAATALKSLAMNGSPSGTAAVQSTENTAVQSQPETRGEADLKFAADSQSHSKTAPVADSGDAEASKIKEPMVVGRETGTAIRTGVPDQQPGTAGLQDTPSIQSSASSGSHNDTGLMNSSGHNMEKTAEPAVVQKETEVGQSDLRNQTMDQIVRKAAVYLKNGQHEVQIDLKPNFLGHIRMQVILDNHQVTVKILAEHGFVKDMIESNIHQLKADLQQQGLEVDKLEVSVSRDPEDSGNFKDKFAQSKSRPGNADDQNDDHPAKEKQRQTGEPRRTADNATTVDYFA